MQELKKDKNYPNVVLNHLKDQDSLLEGRKYLVELKESQHDFENNKHAFSIVLNTPKEQVRILTKK